MVRLMKKSKILTSGFFIIGFPGETRVQMRRTLDYASSLGLDRYFVFNYTPLPGTELAQQAVERGLLPRDYDFETPIHYFIPSFCFPDVPADEWASLHRGAVRSAALATLRRHPIQTLRKYFRMLLFRPRFLLAFVQGWWRFLAGDRAGGEGPRLSAQEHFAERPECPPTRRDQAGRRL
jgi:hypothetical protein